jgi:hypothetical protein
MLAVNYYRDARLDYISYRIKINIDQIQVALPNPGTGVSSRNVA